jgi:hypothetical protein
VNQNAGLSVGIVALLALLAHLAIPPTREAGSAEQTRGGGKAANRQTQQTGGTPETDGPWTATQHFSAPSEKPPFSVVELKDIDFTKPADIRKLFGMPDTDGVECVLATVPDPDHTRLPLLADHSIEAIQRGASEAQWEFATQWLPWSGAAGTGKGGAATAQHAEPGVLVFRHQVPKPAVPGRGWPPGALLVFVAGESPTAGVNPRQFQIARAYMRALCPSDGVKIAGPTFSGSFHSLARLIVQDKDPQQPDKYQYQVESGTAQSPGDINAFLAAARPHVRFHSATQDVAAQHRHLQDLRRELRIPASQVAVLAEDESTFGDAAAGQKPGAHDSFQVFRFPREISHLRDAFHKAVQAAQPQTAPTPNPDFSLTDPNAGEDSIPTFSQTQTPLSQNGVINEITRAIARADIRIVFVSATNVLDELFLAGVLRRQCPDTRVVVENADLLFVQAEQTQPLAGSLFLASYPLFAESQLWEGGNRIDIYPDTLSEGVFHATCSLLAGEGRCPLEPPAPESRGWLLTLDRRGFLPVRTWPTGSSTPDFGGMPSSEGSNILCSGFALFSAAICVWILLLLRNPKWRADARFEPIGCEGGDHGVCESWRGFYLFVFLLTLIAIQAAAGVARVTNDWPHLLDDWPWLAVMAPGCALPAIMMWQGCRPRCTKPGLCLPAWLAAGAVGLAAGDGVLWFLRCGGAGSGKLFSFRVAELRFGSSPLWPIVAALLALLLWCFVHITRLHLASCDEPGIAPDKESPLSPRLDELRNRFNHSAGSAAGLRLTDLADRNPTFKYDGALPVWLGLCLVGLYFLFRVDVQLASIDGSLYDSICIPLQLLLAFLLLLTCWHIRVLWRSLRGFTASLDILPLARAFIQVAPAAGNRPIWVRHFNLQSLEIHLKSALILHDMALLPERSTDSAPSRADVNRWHAQYLECLKAAMEIKNPPSRKDLVETHRKLARLGTDAAGGMWKAMVSAWRSGPLVGKLDGESSSDAAKPVAKAEDGKKQKREGMTVALVVSKSAPPPDAITVSKKEAPETKEAPPHDPPLKIPGDPHNAADLAEGFVALHYSLFLLYGMRQIQNLLWFPSIGFVLLMFSLNSYSFQSPQWIGRFLLLLLVAITLTLGSCLIEIERDPILSRIAGTNPGELNAPFYLKLARYGALPVFGLLASLFPSISNVLFSWMQPALEALK